MKSRSKFVTDSATIEKLFLLAGIEGARNIAPLGAGEFNTLYAVDAADKGYAIKMAPLGCSRTLTYETDMMEQEIFYYSLMRDQAHIRIPDIYHVDFTCSHVPVPYFIMERLAGRSLDQVGFSGAEKAAVERKTAAMVARMHAVKGERFGYRQNGLHDSWYLALVAMVDNLINDGRRFGRRSRNGKKLLNYIEQNRSILETVPSRLINFDVWAPNIICENEDGELKLAWIDPERCLFGDPIADFVCLEFMNMNLDKKVNSITAYNEASDAPITVTDSERIRYAIMLGYLGLIMEVEKYARYSLFHFGWWRNVAACKFLFKNCFEQLRELACRSG